MKKQETSKIDPNLDTPSEANTTKNINFLDEEDNGSSRNNDNDDFSKRRKEEWQQGVEEGKQARENDQ